MRFTIIIPTYNNGPTIRAALTSVAFQTVNDYEVFVVADGAPEETHRIVKEYAARDKRIRLLPFAKGERHGEGWRHAALQQATGEAVCYLSDDDFWFPDHLALMANLLQDADFAHTRHVHLLPCFHIYGNTGTFADPAVRERMRKEKFNVIGLTNAAHRLAAYASLPQGWSPAPPDVWTDLYMWRKWLNQPGMRYAASDIATGIHMGRDARQNIDPVTAAHEPLFWLQFFSAPHMIGAFRDLLPRNETWLPMSAIMQEAIRRGQKQKPA